MSQTVGTSDLKTSRHAGDVLVTHLLGSSIGLSLYDPIARVGGLVHCMLPLSTRDPDKAKANPEMFTDTGVTALLKAVLDLGAKREHLIVKVAGAASLLDEDGLFKIGTRNYTVLRKLLWKHDLLIDAQDLGGTMARTLSLHMATGRTTIRFVGQEVEL